MADAIIQLVDDTSNTGKKVDTSSLTVGSNTVHRQRFNITDPTVATGLATVGATNAALSETALASLRTASHMFGLDSGAGAGSQQVPLQVESTAQPNLRVSHWNAGNKMPAGDSAAREIFVGLADGTTGPAAVMAASTAAAATDKALVVALSPNNSAAAAATAGTVANKSWLAGVQFLANASLPALTTAQQVAIQGDQLGNQKVCVMPGGVAIYGSTDSGGAAAANVTLTIPSAKMGYLDGFDIDGLGATSGAAIAITVTGILGGTLTYRMPIQSGATTPNPSFSKRFNPPLQASAVATNLVVNVPSFGSGNTASSCNAYGHYI